MSNLDNLTSKILSDSEAKAAAIRTEAEHRGTAIIQEYTRAADEEKKRILEEGAREAANASEQMLLAKKLEIRDSNLNAKQELVNQVFTIAVEKLNNMNKDEYFSFLCGCLENMDLDGEELVIPSKYHVTDLGELNTYLQSKGKKGNLRLSPDGDIDGGFLLEKHGIQNNNTFDAMVSFYRYELESEIIKALF